MYQNKSNITILLIYTITVAMISSTLTALICAAIHVKIDSETVESQESYFVEEAEKETIYLGEYYVVPYCGCSECCGNWGVDRPVSIDGTEIVYTANQTIAIEGITVAANPEIFPYGTELIIDGHEYIVQDNGADKSTIYLYFSSHSDAVEYGVKMKDVYTY